MKNLESAQVREIVDCMYPKNYFKGDIIVQEGDTGHALYVIAGKYIYNCEKFEEAGNSSDTEEWVLFTNKTFP